MEYFISRSIIIFMTIICIANWIRIEDQNEIIEGMGNQVEVLTDEINAMIDENGTLKSEVLEFQQDNEFMQNELDAAREQLFYCQLHATEE